MSNNAPDYENNLAFDPDINTMPRCDIEALKSEIERLKELLNECRCFIDFCTPKCFRTSKGSMLTKIDNAIRSY